jgi:hypothetical protein
MAVTTKLIKVTLMLGLVCASGALGVPNTPVWDYFQFMPPGSFTQYSITRLQINDKSVTFHGGFDNVDQVSAIYRSTEGVATAEFAVPHVGNIYDIYFESPTKGWAVGQNGILEYDGVFWVKKVNYASDGFPHISHDQISHVPQGDVWFSSGYRYTNGEYESFTMPGNDDTGKIFMRDNEFGVISHRRGYYLLRDGVWSSVEDRGIGRFTKFHISGDDIYYTSRDSSEYADSLWVLNKEGVRKGLFGHRSLRLLAVEEDRYFWMSLNSGEYIARDTTAIMRRQNWVRNGNLIRYDLVNGIPVILSGNTENIQRSFKSYRDNDGSDVDFEGDSRQSEGLAMYKTSRASGAWGINLPFTDLIIFSDGLLASHMAYAPRSGYWTAPLITETIVLIDTLRFDAVPSDSLASIGEVRYKSAYLANAGNSPAIVSNISAVGEMFRAQPHPKSSVFIIPFAVDENVGVIAPGDSVEIVVAYVPSSTGRHEGFVVVDMLGREGAQYRTKLYGATIGSSGPLLEAPDALTFGSVMIGKERQRELLLTNAGTSVLTIDSVRTSSDTWRVAGAVGPVNAGSSIAVDVGYAPRASGNESGEIIVWSDDPNYPMWSVALGGVGMRPDPPDIVAGLTELAISPSRAFESDVVTVAVTGVLPATNARVKVEDIAVGDAIVITIAPEWESDASEAVDEAWEVSVDLPPLKAGAYEVFIRAGREYVATGALTVAAGPVTRGPVSLDFNMLSGDQGKTRRGRSAQGQRVATQFFVEDAPAITGWSAEMVYDPQALTYLSGSFEAGDFVPSLTTLVDDKEGLVNVGGAVLSAVDPSRGSGWLGALEFEINEGFADSTTVILTKVIFRLAEGGEDARSVHFEAVVTAADDEEGLLGDFNVDGVVDFIDFFRFADAFGGSDPVYDLNASGKVDFSDFFLFADLFGTDDRAKLMVLAAEYIGVDAGGESLRCYPNPFNATTEIAYQPRSAGQAELHIYSLTGQRVRRLTDNGGPQGLRRVRWDGRDDSGREVGSGLYIVRLQATGQVWSTKVMLIR